MSYDYESCFWDPHDDGVNILLTHVQAGIKSCGTVENFFKQRVELEKDYARRLGAINEKLMKNLESSPEFGHLGKSLQTLLEVEKSKAHAHSKQSEIIYRQAYSNTKLFGGELQARYTTLSGKIEKMRVDKFNKKKGCEELTNRLEKATVRARDLRLNQNNIIGSKRVEQNEKELAKWENNQQEFKLQLNVLKQEYKASQRYWLHEWGDMTCQLQEMEQARIQFIQAKLQVYIEAGIETSIVEQSKLDLLNSKLVTFTPIDDISSFSSEYGTGRLKEKHRTNKTNNRDYSMNRRISNGISSIEDDSADYRSSRVSYNHTGKDSYIDNIRKLSSNLQNRSQNRNSQYGKPDDKPSTLQNNNSNSDSTIIATTSHRYEPPSRKKTENQYDDLMKNSENRPITPPPEPQHVREIPSPEPIKEPVLQPPQSHNGSSNSYTTSESSSNPTDFTTHLKKRESMESMTTSVSSMASSIGDAQRFSKSWNSSTRKRKSINHINQLLNDETDKTRHTSTNTVINSQFGHKSLPPVEHIRNSTNTSRSSTSYDTRRKSMVLESSTNPIEDALYEMERLQGSTQADAKKGRVKDNGLIVTLPLVTRGGERVIKYAKANFPLLDNGAPELANFEKNDYILITEIISNDWYRGEVYDNEKISPQHREGLIPYNFVSILG